MPYIYKATSLLRVLIVAVDVSFDRSHTQSCHNTLQPRANQCSPLAGTLHHTTPSSSHRVSTAGPDTHLQRCGIPSGLLRPESLLVLLPGFTQRSPEQGGCVGATPVVWKVVDINHHQLLLHLRSLVLLMLLFHRR